MLGNLLRGLREDKFFLILFAGLLVFSALVPERIADYPSLVDWSTVAALTGLLLLTKGLELSGMLHRLGRMLVGLMATERAAALCLVGVAALLSTVLTNDVALFVVVPLTLSVCRLTKMPATKLIIFEALAVNAGSALTPIGNPQNLFLWQLAKVSFGEFVRHMSPLVMLLTLALLGLTAIVFSERPIQAHDDANPVGLDRPLLGVSLAMYLPFLIATDMHRAGLAVAAIVLVYAVWRSSVLKQLDWGLLLVFMLMFIDLRLLAGLDVVRHAMQSLGLDRQVNLYLASIGASQIISNVPATIALVEYSKNWRVIAYGVNVGGFGFMVGSLANLIALRLSGDRKAWLSFHFYAIPALVVAAALGYAVLFVGALA